MSPPDHNAMAASGKGSGSIPDPAALQQFSGVCQVFQDPHLLNIIQVSPRIIQATLKKKGGNLHIVGVDAPHSGLDFDTDREPF